MKMLKVVLHNKKELICLLLKPSKIQGLIQLVTSFENNHSFIEIQDSSIHHIQCINIEMSTFIDMYNTNALRLLNTKK